MTSAVELAPAPAAPAAADSAARSDGADGEPRAAAAPPSFEATYAEHFAFVWRVARRLGVAAASIDDVVQEVFLVVHRRLPEFEGRSSLRSWLFAIALGIVRNHRRAARRRGDTAAGGEVVAAEAEASPEMGPDGRLEQAQAVRTLHAILDELDDDRREVFVLAELEQLTAPEIADALGLNVNTVYTRLRAARRDFDQAVARRRAREAWRSR